MSKIIMGLLIIVVLVLCFLLFWMVVLSLALLFFGRREGKERKLLTGHPETS